MSHLLWQAYFEINVDQFRSVLARATHQTFSTQGRAKSLPNALSSSPGAHVGLSGTSPTVARHRKASGQQQQQQQHRHTDGDASTGAVTLGRADVNWKDGNGVTLLHRIASCTFPSAPEFGLALLRSCPLVDLYVQDEESGWTALHRALYNGNTTIARSLMDRDVQDAMQYSSTSSATHPAGGLIKIKDREGYSPFDLYNESIANRSIRHATDPPLIGSGVIDDEDGEMAHGVSGDANHDDSSTGTVAPQICINGDEVFAFGSNNNFTLGLGDEDDRQFPERVQIKRPDHLLSRFWEEYRADTQSSPARMSKRGGDAKMQNTPFGMFEMPAFVRYRPIVIQDIQLAKLHSALLTTDSEANLYMCGFGSGGRLGTGDETTRFSYVSIHGGALAGKRVVHIGLGQNHTIAISSEGETFTWGSNAFGQLGYAATASASGLKDEEPVQLLPRQVFGPLKREVVIGAAASRIHTAVHTALSLYTFGKNEGQMGLVDSDARSLISQNTPRKVGASLFCSTIRSVSAIDKATTCLLDNFDVWVFANYGYTRVNFAVDHFADSVLDTSSDSGARRQPRQQTMRGNEVVKITAGGDTICAMTAMGDVFTMQVSQKAAEGSTSLSSTTNPAKIRGALSLPQRVWSLRKAHMAVRDVDVGQDGSIIICTASGSVWRRAKRAKIKDATAAGLLETRAKDYKFARVPGLTRIMAVRSNTFGAYAAVRKDCDVLQTQIEVASTELWKNVLPLLPFGGLGAEDSDTEDPVPRFWTSSRDKNDMAMIRRAVLLSANIEAELGNYFIDHRISNGASYDLQLGTTVSDVRIPIHAFMLAGRSNIVSKALRTFREAYFYSITDVANLEYDKDGKALILFQGIDFLTLLNLVLYVYTDSVVDVWHHTRRSPELTYRYRQIRSELMKIAAGLEMKRFEHAIRLMTDPPRVLHEDLGLAIKDPSYFSDGDIEIELDGSTQMVHSALVCRRCPFFEGLLQGRAAGGWLSSRRGNDPEDPLVVDLSHIDPNIFDYILQHIYSDTDETMFDNAVTADLDSYLDLVIEVMGVANELMLERLAQCCQKTLGKYVTTRNVCQLLNAVAPCAVTAFKDAALEYICLNLEGMLENRLLDELDEDLMLELDEVVRQNQLSCLPISKSGRAELQLLETYPQLEDLLEHSKRTKVDQVRLASRLNERESKLVGAPKVKGDLLEDFAPSSLNKKSPKLAARDAGNVAKSPVLKASRSTADLMFAMDEFDSESPVLSTRAATKSGRSSTIPPTTPTSTQELGKSPDAAATRMPQSPASVQHRQHGSLPFESDKRNPSEQHEPWASTPVSTTKLDMKDIMAQASGIRTSNISSALSQQPKPLPKSPALGAKVSQRERKKQQQYRQSQTQQPMLETEDSTFSVIPQTRTPQTPSSSPWQKASTGPRVSLKDVLGSERDSVHASKDIARTPSPMTLRQTVAGKGSTSRIFNISKTPSSVLATPSTALKSTSSPIPQTDSRSPNISNRKTPILTPPRSVTTSPTIHSIRHIPTRPIIEPALQLSMDEILTQQQTEKEVLKEAVSKRSLMEIQEEQAFQEWWDREARKAQGDTADADTSDASGARSRPGRDTGSKGRGRGNNRARIRGRGRGRGTSMRESGREEKGS